MKTIQFIPGAIATPNAITLPTPAPDIDAVVTAEIERIPAALGNADHAAADVVAAFADHTQAEVIAAFADHTQANIVAAFDDHAAAAVIVGVIDHPQADIVGAILDHPVHAHNVEVGIAAVAEAFGASGAGATDLGSTTGQTIPGGGATGVQDLAAVQAHAVGAAPVAHAAGVALVHAVGVVVAHAVGVAVAHTAGVAVAHGAAASPVTAAVPTRITTRTLSLDVNTLLGDLLVLNYLEMGERVKTS